MDKITALMPKSPHFEPRKVEQVECFMEGMVAILQRHDICPITKLLCSSWGEHD